MKTTGIKLETLVQAIYEEILAIDGFDTVDVQHDVKVEGKSGQPHQIDVFWEFKVAGVTHRCAVECKEYKGTVSIGKVRDFSAVLDDIGNVNGIFITTNGFQSGAVRFAKHKDIMLKVVRPPSKEDISKALGIKTLVLNIHGIFLGRCDMEPLFDMNWILDNTDINEGDAISFGARTDEIEVVDCNNVSLGTIEDFHKQLPKGKETASGLKHEVSFENAFLKVPNMDHRLKINGIKFDYDVDVFSDESRTSYKFMAKAVLQDVITGEKFFHKKKVQSCRQ